MNFVHFSLRERVRVVKLENMDFGSRYVIDTYISDFDGPIMHIDTDIVVAKPIDAILRSINCGLDIYISDEGQRIFPQCSKMLSPLL